MGEDRDWGKGISIVDTFVHYTKGTGGRVGRNDMMTCTAVALNAKRKQDRE